eukprot:SAG25_NODE_77_length_16915_cov_13.448204_8_plen_91_part_00
MKFRLHILNVRHQFAYGVDIVRIANEQYTSDDACMWRRPDPTKDFVLAVGFAIQRGCANTLLRAASRRKSRRSSSPVDPALYNPRAEIDA